MTQTITLKGLTCDACIKLTTRKFMRIPGVASARITLDGRAYVEANRAIEMSEYEQALVGLPYEVVAVQ